MNYQLHWSFAVLPVALTCCFILVETVLSEDISLYVRDESDRFILGNAFLEREVRRDPARLTTRLTNKLANRTIEVRSEGFRLKFGDNRWFTARDFRRVKSYIQGGSSARVIQTLSLPDPKLQVEVHFNLEKGEHFTHKWLVVRNVGDAPIRLDTVSVESFALAREKVIRSIPERSCALRNLGRPVFTETCFFGLEYPASYNIASSGGITLTQYPGITVAPGAAWRSRSAVFGVAEPMEIEKRFKSYITAVQSKTNFTSHRHYQDGKWSSPWWQMNISDIGRESHLQNIIVPNWYDAFITARDSQIYELWQEYASQVSYPESVKGSANASYLTTRPLGYRVWHRLCRELTEIVEEEQARHYIESYLGSAEDFDEKRANGLLMAAIGRGPLLEYICGDDKSFSEITVRSKFQSTILEWLQSHRQRNGKSRVILGDPRRSEPYGYLHRWNNRIFLVLRNPTIETRAISLHLRTLLGLFEQGTQYVCELIWPYREGIIADCSSDSELRVSLSDFELKVFEFTPRTLLRLPIIFGAAVQLTDYDKAKEQPRCVYDVWGEPGTRKTISVLGARLVQPADTRTDGKMLNVELQFPGKSYDRISASLDRLEAKEGRIKLTMTMSIPQGYENVKLEIFHRLDRRLSIEPYKAYINGKLRSGLARRKDVSANTSRWHSVPLTIGEYECAVELPAGRSNEIGAWVVGDARLTPVQITLHAICPITNVLQLPVLSPVRKRITVTVLPKRKLDCTVNYHPAAAVKFNGKDSRVRCGTGADRSDNFTVEAWVLFNRKPGPGTPHQPIAARWNPKTRSGWLFYCRSCGGDAGMCLYTTGGAEAIHRTWKAEAGRWYHVAMSVENGHGRVFIDGEVVAQARVSIPSLPTTDITIGWFQKSQEEHSLVLSGMISELRISRSARYTEEFIPPVRLKIDKDTLALWRFEKPGALEIANMVKNGIKARLENGAKIISISKD